MALEGHTASYDWINRSLMSGIVFFNYLNWLMILAHEYLLVVPHLKWQLSIFDSSFWFKEKMIKTSVERDKRFGQKHVIQIPKSCVQCCAIFSFVTILLSGFVVFHILAEDSEVEKTTFSTFDIGLKIKIIIYKINYFDSKKLYF